MPAPWFCDTLLWWYSPVQLDGRVHRHESSPVSLLGRSLILGRCCGRWRVSPSSLSCACSWAWVCHTCHSSVDAPCYDGSEHRAAAGRSTGLSGAWAEPGQGEVTRNTRNVFILHCSLFGPLDCSENMYCVYLVTCLQWLHTYQLTTDQIAIYCLWKESFVKMNIQRFISKLCCSFELFVLFLQPTTLLFWLIRMALTRPVYRHSCFQQKSLITRL